ncbi:MAG: DNA recombination protein RmuC [Melioribacteraceae bacterium]|nr:DNA recombination protein RmuC [Melioribacteraceae bacterium]MCF8356485.1 DNA recombination protein RmuC [Melioribacteraceae bacterium]MCF8394862.1 DNA recombination protein RmuC [Melioribacteraceae bacterium]MCF8420590.1 DNA recombination protein RmuC [Melioribacteraceae bacterium]
MDIISIIIAVSLIGIIFILLVLLSKISKINTSAIEESIKNQLTQTNEKFEKIIRDEFSRNREEITRNSKDQREELSNSLKLFSDQLFSRMSEVSKMQKDQLGNFKDQLGSFEERMNKLTQTLEQKSDKLQDKVSEHLNKMVDNNEKKLEEMRRTVDEKLHETLEKRLGESFKLVSERLELVHKGLGEMQSLANGVGDLKKVLTNVKTRGTWGEIQLENLLEQVLTLDQYEKNVATKPGSNARVEFAIKLPGRNNEKDEVVWMPIDSKFPLEDYQRMVEAQDTANVAALEEASKALENRIKSEAKTISEKYLAPPNTTDFAFLFLPIEGLYAEVLRRPGLFDFVQREYRVTIVGPTTFLAVLNSLQMGFRTLAIEKRSSEVWKLLGAVKTEFGKFGDLLDKTHKKLQEATNSIDTASRKSRTIERKLRDVQELPSTDTLNLLMSEDEDQQSREIED